LIADGFEQGRQAEVAGAAQEAVTGADDESQSFGGEGVMTQTGPVHLSHDELFKGFRSRAS